MFCPLVPSLMINLALKSVIYLFICPIYIYLLLFRFFLSTHLPPIFYFGTIEGQYLSMYFGVWIWHKTNMHKHYYYCYYYCFTSTSKNVGFTAWCIILLDLWDRSILFFIQRCHRNAIRKREIWEHCYQASKQEKLTLGFRNLKAANLVHRTHVLSQAREERSSV